MKATKVVDGIIDLGLGRHRRKFLTHLHSDFAGSIPGSGLKLPEEDMMPEIAWTGNLARYL